MTTRREFLEALSWPAAAAAAAALVPPALSRSSSAFADLAATGVAPEEAARDEALWFEVQQAFSIDRSMINLNNGGVSLSPRDWSVNQIHAWVKLAVNPAWLYATPPFTSW